VKGERLSMYSGLQALRYWGRIFTAWRDENNKYNACNEIGERMFLFHKRKFSNRKKIQTTRHWYA